MATVKTSPRFKPRDPWSKDPVKITTQAGETISYKEPSYKFVDTEATQKAQEASTLVPTEQLLKTITLADRRGIDMVPSLEGQNWIKENIHMSGEKIREYLWDNNLIEFASNRKHRKPGKGWMHNVLEKMGVYEARKGRMEEMKEKGLYEKASTLNLESNKKMILDLLERRPEVLEQVKMGGSKWGEGQSIKAIIESTLKEEGKEILNQFGEPYPPQEFRAVLKGTPLEQARELRGQVSLSKNHDILILEALRKGLDNPEVSDFGLKSNLLEFINNDPALVERAKELGVSDILEMPRDKIAQRAMKLWKGRGDIMKNPDPINQALVNSIQQSAAESTWGKGKQAFVKWKDIPEGAELTNNKYYVDKWNSVLYDQKAQFTPQYASNIMTIVRNTLNRNFEREGADAFLPELQNISAKNFWESLVKRKKEYNSNVYKKEGKLDPLTDVIVDEHITPVWAGGGFGLNNRQFIFSGAHGGSSAPSQMKIASGIKEGGGPKGLRQKGYIDILIYKLNQKIQNAGLEGNWDVVNSAVNNKGKIMNYVNSVGLYKVDMSMEPGKLYKMDNKPTWRSNATRENFRSDADYARYQDAIKTNSVSKDRHSKLDDLQRLEREFDLLSETTGKEVMEKADFEEGGLVPPQHIQSSLASVDEVLNGIY